MSACADVPSQPSPEYERLGVTPTPDDGTRLSASRAVGRVDAPASRPPRRRDVAYSDTGRQVGQHLVDVHDMLRRELTELREIVAQVRDGALDAGDARSALNEMAMRQNDWTLGAFCSRYCHAVARHHGLEDDAIFPHLARSDAALAPVIDRLADEHLTIHDAIEAGRPRARRAHQRPHDFDAAAGGASTCSPMRCCRTSPTRSTSSSSRSRGSASTPTRSERRTYAPG